MGTAAETRNPHFRPSRAKGFAARACEGSGMNPAAPHRPGFVTRRILGCALVAVVAALAAASVACAQAPSCHSAPGPGCLQSNRIELASGGVAEWQRK